MLVEARNFKIARLREQLRVTLFTLVSRPDWFSTIKWVNSVKKFLRKGMRDSSD